MLFVLTCIDRPGAGAIRAATREAHLAYVRGHGDAVVAGGPFLDADGAMTGSMLILEMPGRAAAEAFAAGDPYAQAGLFASVEIRAWRWLINDLRAQL